MCELHRRDEESETKASVSGFVDELVVAIANGRIYGRSHPRSERSVEAVRANLEQLLANSTATALEIGAHEGYLIHAERPLLGASLSAPKLIRPLSQMAAGGIRFQSGATVDEIHAMIELLGRKDLAHLGRIEAGQALAAAGVSHLELLPGYSEEHRGPGVGTTVESLEPGDVAHYSVDVPLELYQGVVDLLQDVMVKACRGDDLTTDDARGYVDSILSQLDKDSLSMMGASRYEKYDAFTFGHSIRVCFLALNFARILTDDVPTLHRIGTAALLHDVGKAWVPFEVLHSTARLNPEERREMNLHTLHGGEILLGMEDVDPLAVAVAFGHHRTMDGGGYPDAVHAPHLSFGTGLVKICDVYEALTAVRPYKTRMSPTRAFRVMMAMKSQFDADLMSAFIRHTGVYPVGSRVRLTGGTVARVLSQTEAITRPVVKLELAASGEVLHAEDSLTLDLSDSAEGMSQVEGLVLEGAD